MPICSLMFRCLTLNIMLCTLTMLIVGHVHGFWFVVGLASMAVCDSVAPGMCTPCGLLSHVSPTMCFIIRSCGMMDFYYWSPYVFHRIAVLVLRFSLGLVRTAYRL